MSNKQQPGFGVVEIILAVAVVFLLGVVGWMAYSRSDQAKQSNSATSESVAEHEGQAEEATPASKQYLEVPEAGIKIPLSAEIEDLNYTLISNSDDGSYVWFSTDKLEAICEWQPTGALGSLSAIYEQGDYTDATLLGQVNSRYLYYYPGEYCSKDRDVRNEAVIMQEKGEKILIDAIKKAEPLN